MLQPLDNTPNLFVIQVEESNQTEGGLLLTNTKLTGKAVILAVPPMEDKDELVGKTILYEKDLAFKITVEGESYTVIPKDDIYGILE